MTVTGRLPPGGRGRRLVAMLIPGIAVAALLVAVVMVRDGAEPVGCEWPDGPDAVWCELPGGRGTGGCPMPDVVGTDSGVASYWLKGEGILSANEFIESSYVATDRPQGEVLAAYHDCSSGAVQLLVSDGGPVAQVLDIPIEHRPLLGDDVPLAAPVRVIDTPFGPAWKTDDVIIERCDSDAWHYATDTDYTLKCYGSSVRSG